MAAHAVGDGEEAVGHHVRVFVELTAQPYVRAVTVVDVRPLEGFGAVVAQSHSPILSRIVAGL
ncbi:hypothetical protein [Nesterenkonia pannonica]|uniref:hypothetical protein n=1 Tax=Nesterenkonia pannonica TaxID=1548602 RepID=UPI002164AA3C|nr:hypothetical protein [Nesterenkonia pannonica]